MLPRTHPRQAAWCLTSCLAWLSGLLCWSLAENRAADVIPQFRRVVVDADPPPQPYYKMIGDLTGDGNLEIVIAGRAGPIVMYSRPDWRKTVIASGGFRGGVNGEIADLNGDGRADLVMGGVWFENPGAAGAEWTVHRIDEQGVHDTLTADLTGNGRLDVVGRDQSAFGRRGNEIFIYYQQDPRAWKKEVLDCPHGEGIQVADLDSDGRRDIVIGGSWYRNERSRWTRHTFAPAWTEPDTKVGLGDINGDGRLDIVLTPAELKGERYKISWFESPASDPTSAWTEHILVPEIECVIHSLALADFNRDKTVDVAYAMMHQGTPPNEVVVLFNFEKAARWERRILDTAGSHDIRAADLTGDGVIDLIGANHAGVAPLVLWENQLVVD